MRVTVDIDEGLLRTARDLARLKHQSLGRVISDLAQQGLMPRPIRYVETRNGIPLLPTRPGARPVTDEDVKALLELDD
jgi:hypothetical protein